MKGNNQTFQGMNGKVGTYVVYNKDGVTVVRARNFSNGSQSSQQVAQRAVFSHNSQSWRTLPKEVQAAWTRLGLQMTDPDGKRKKPFLSGPQAYASINGVLAAMGSDPVSAPPDAPQGPLPILPTVQLVAARTGGSGGTFSLRLLSGAFPGKVMVFAAPACSAGRNFWSASAFRLLETVDNLANGSTSIAASFVDKFGEPAVGEQIAVKLRPVTDTGFKGMTLTLTALVGTAAEGAASGDDTSADGSPLQMG